MKQGHRYKTEPTFKQKRLLERFFGCVRHVYNWGLQRKMDAYYQNGEHLSYIDLAKELTQYKKQEGKEWLSVPANDCLQQALRHNDNAWTNFFKKRADHPVKKTKKNSKPVCKFVGKTLQVDFELWRIKLPKLGWVRICKNKTFDLETNKILSATVTKTPAGEYYVSILTENDQTYRPKPKVCKERSVGVDLGIKDYAVLSNGKKFDNPRFLERNMEKLKYLQKRFSRKQKGSNRRERFRKRIARLHQHIHDQRVSYIHEMTSYLIRNYDTICLEDLNIKGMMKNHNLAQAIQSVGWGEFIRQLTYKSEWYGRNLVFIGRFEPSSQTCHCCGYRNREVKDLDIREWTCPECGERHDRDVNAAINIRNMALHPQNLVAFENKIPEMTGIPTGR